MHRAACGFCRPWSLLLARYRQWKLPIQCNFSPRAISPIGRPAKKGGAGKADILIVGEASVSSLHCTLAIEPGEQGTATIIGEHLNPIKLSSDPSSGLLSIQGHWVAAVMVMNQQDLLNSYKAHGAVRRTLGCAQ